MHMSLARHEALPPRPYHCVAFAMKIVVGRFLWLTLGYDTGQNLDVVVNYWG